MQKQLNGGILSPMLKNRTILGPWVYMFTTTMYIWYDYLDLNLLTLKFWLCPFSGGKIWTQKFVRRTFSRYDISKDIENYNYYKFHSAPTDVVFLGIMISQSLKSPERYNSLLYLQRNKSWIYTILLRNLWLFDIP